MTHPNEGSEVLGNSPDVPEEVPAEEPAPRTRASSGRGFESTRRPRVELDGAVDVASSTVSDGHARARLTAAEPVSSVESRLAAPSTLIVLGTAQASAPDIADVAAATTTPTPDTVITVAAPAPRKTLALAVHRVITVALTLVQALTEAAGRFVDGLLGIAMPSRSPIAGIGNPVIPTFTGPDGKVYGGPDPFITYNDGMYYATYTSWDHIEIRSAPSLALLSIAEPHIVFPSSNTAPPAEQAANVWAPELHLLDGPNGKRWYLYYSAESKNSVFFTGHRMFVLESQGDSPTGPYAPAGVMLDTHTSGMTIDGTVYQAPDGRQYLFFGATPQGGFGTENIYVQELENPWTTKGDPVLVATPTYGWEQRGSAINEAPQILVNGDRLNVVYSAGAYFFPAGYSLGLVSVPLAADLLDAQTWVGAKRPQPLFTTNLAAGVWAPGHNSFFSSPDGTQTWFVYHAYSVPFQGLLAGQYLFGASASEYRTARIQQVQFAQDGTPVLGVPDSLSNQVVAPAGDPGLTVQIEGLHVTTTRALTTSLVSKSLVGQTGTRILLSPGGSATFTVTVPPGEYDVYLRQRPTRYSDAFKVTLGGGAPISSSSGVVGVGLGSVSTDSGSVDITLTARNLAIVDLDEVILVRR
ncbi:glycoside hydrolase family 43 protein [Mycolicibacterium sp. Y3]